MPAAKGKSKGNGSGRGKPKKGKYCQKKMLQQLDFAMAQTSTQNYSNRSKEQCWSWHSYNFSASLSSKQILSRVVLGVGGETVYVLLNSYTIMFARVLLITKWGLLQISRSIITTENLIMLHV
jgi:hypothetical protein